MSLLGVVLSGGQSSRMGSNKADLELVGESLVARMIRLLEPACDELVVSVAKVDSASRWREVVDVQTGIGPMAGLLAARDYAVSAGHDTLFLTSCDLFGFQAEWVSRLPDATSAFFDDRWQPMVSKWTVKELALLEPNKTGLWRVLEAFDAQRVSPPDSWAESFSVNTPQDYERAKKCLLNHPERYR